MTVWPVLQTEHVKLMRQTSIQRELCPPRQAGYTDYTTIAKTRMIAMENLVRGFSSNGESDYSGRQRQSIRTKFRLSISALEAKEFIAEHFGISQKEAAMVAVSNFELFLDSLEGKEKQSVVDRALDNNTARQRKTHVISRETKGRLEALTEMLDTSRDNVFDTALRFMESLIQFRQEKQVEQHEKLLPTLEDLGKKLANLNHWPMLSWTKTTPSEKRSASSAWALKTCFETCATRLSRANLFPPTITSCRAATTSVSTSNYSYPTHTLVKVNHV